VDTASYNTNVNKNYVTGRDISFAFSPIKPLHYHVYFIHFHIVCTVIDIHYQYQDLFFR